QIEAWLGDPEVSLRATLSPEEAYRDATYVLIATPTDYDPKTNRFDTRSIDAVVQDVRRIQPQAAIVIKSTVPVGYTRALRERLGAENLFFAPEFLREGKALHDNLYPSRIVVGDKSAVGEQFALMMREAS